MSNEFWVGILIAITFPLLGLAWGNVQWRLTRLDREMNQKLAELEQALRQDAVDKHIDLRHQVKNIQESMMKSVTDDRRASVDQMMEQMKLMIDMLKMSGTDSIIAKRQIKRQETGGGM